MKKKKTTQKIKSKARGITKKTESLFKKTTKKASEIAHTLERQWKKEQPQREKLKKATNKTIKNGIEITGSVFETIKKDVSKINRRNKVKE